MPERHDDSRLPLDSDIEVSESRKKRKARPVHLHWRYIALVALGGTLGTAARYLLTEAIPSWQRVPVTTIGINVLGAFALGVLLEELTRRGSVAGRRRALRLLAGTGFLGGFTTYSSLAVDTDALFRGGLPWLAVAYALATVVLGVLAAGCGIALAAVRRRARGPESSRGIDAALGRTLHSMSDAAADPASDSASVSTK